MAENTKNDVEDLGKQIKLCVCSYLMSNGFAYMNEHDKVINLKDRIVSSEVVPDYYRVLIFNGQILDDSKKLSDYGINNECEIKLLLWRRPDVLITRDNSHLGCNKQIIRILNHTNYKELVTYLPLVVVQDSRMSKIFQILEDEAELNNFQPDLIAEEPRQNVEKYVIYDNNAPNIDDLKRNEGNIVAVDIKENIDPEFENMYGNIPFMISSTADGSLYASNRVAAICSAVRVPEGANFTEISSEKSETFIAMDSNIRLVKYRCDGGLRSIARTEPDLLNDSAEYLFEEPNFKITDEIFNIDVKNRIMMSIINVCVANKLTFTSTIPPSVMKQIPNIRIVNCSRSVEVKPVEAHEIRLVHKNYIYKLKYLGKEFTTQAGTEEKCQNDKIRNEFVEKMRILQHINEIRSKMGNTTTRCNYDDHCMATECIMTQKINGVEYCCKPSINSVPVRPVSISDLPKYYKTFPTSYTSYTRLRNVFQPVEKLTVNGKTRIVDHVADTGWTKMLYNHNRNQNGSTGNKSERRFQNREDNIKIPFSKYDTITPLVSSVIGPEQLPDSKLFVRLCALSQRPPIYRSFSSPYSLMPMYDHPEDKIAFLGKILPISMGVAFLNNDGKVLNPICAGKFFFELISNSDRMLATLLSKSRSTVLRILLNDTFPRICGTRDVFTSTADIEFCDMFVESTILKTPCAVARLKALIEDSSSTVPNTSTATAITSTGSSTTVTNTTSVKATTNVFSATTITSSSVSADDPAGRLENPEETNASDISCNSKFEVGFNGCLNDGMAPVHGIPVLQSNASSSSATAITSTGSSTTVTNTTSVKATTNVFSVTTITCSSVSADGPARRLENPEETNASDIRCNSKFQVGFSGCLHDGMVPVLESNASSSSLSCFNAETENILPSSAAAISEGTKRKRSGKCHSTDQSENHNCFCEDDEEMSKKKQN